jgi:hypothetical protein
MPERSEERVDTCLLGTSAHGSETRARPEVSVRVQLPQRLGETCTQGWHALLKSRQHRVSPHATLKTDPTKVADYSAAICYR